jgi:hypothetical protein
MSREQARHWDLDPQRIEGDLAIPDDDDRDDAVRSAPVMQHVPSSEVDDQIVGEARHAEIIGKLHRFVEIAGRGREHFDNDDGIGRNQRVAGDRSRRN